MFERAWFGDCVGTAQETVCEVGESRIGESLGWFGSPTGDASALGFLPLQPLFLFVQPPRAAAAAAFATSQSTQTVGDRVQCTVHTPPPPSEQAPPIARALSPPPSEQAPHTTKPTPPPSPPPPVTDREPASAALTDADPPKLSTAWKVAFSEALATETLQALVSLDRFGARDRRPSMRSVAQDLVRRWYHDKHAERLHHKPATIALAALFWALRVHGRGRSMAELAGIMPSDPATLASCCHHAVYHPIALAFRLTHREAPL
jgi:hypothetical protein